MQAPAFGPLDYSVLLAYFALCAGVGYWAGRGQKDTKDYFKAGGQMPMWAVCLSILATETSALTVFSVPGMSYVSDLTYFQFVCGSVLGRILVATVFIAAFYKAGVTSVYEYLGIRFGSATRGTASVLFLITRTLASGVRLTAASLAVEAVTGWGFVTCVVAFTAVTILYTVFGGIKSIIWTDVLQFFLFVGGAVLALILILGDIGLDGLSAAVKDAAPLDKLNIVDGSLDATKKFTIWTALFGGTLLTFATHGTDQDLAQRILTCKESSQGKRSVIWSGIINLPMVMLFLLIGTCLYAFYAKYPALRDALPVDTSTGVLKQDRVFPHFIVHQIPAGIRGLVIAAVFAAAMSSTSSAIGALASVAMIDVYKRMIPGASTPRRDLFVSRVLAGVVSVVLVIVAVVFERLSESLLNEGLAVMTYAYGALLGVFVLGRLTNKRGSDRGNVAAMLISIYAVLTIKFNALFFPVLAFGSREYAVALFPRPLAWPWFIVMGFGVTLVVGILFKTPGTAVPGCKTNEESP
jgi:solute:Na+ symporter, SSS family